MIIGKDREPKHDFVLKRRDAKRLAKEQQVLELYFKQGMKPKQISKSAKLTVEQVNNVLRLAKKDAKKILEPPAEKPKKLRMSEMPDLVEAVTSFIEINGTFNVTISKIIAHLKTLKDTDPAKHQFPVPSAFVVHQILRQRLYLQKSTFDTANFRYNDPTFNEKRLWISRLLAQFLFEDALIITVDESHFRTDQVTAKQWQFQERLVGSKRNRPQSKCVNSRRQRIMTADPLIASYGEVLYRFEGKDVGSDDGVSELMDAEDIGVLDNLE